MPILQFPKLDDLIAQYVRERHNIDVGWVEASTEELAHAGRPHEEALVVFNRIADFMRPNHDVVPFVIEDPHKRVTLRHGP
jgi:hypothetical protein